VPFDAVSVWPACAVPEIDGNGEIVNVDGDGGGVEADV
jgi:hypothetical protein